MNLSACTETHVVVSYNIIYKEDGRSDDQSVIQVYLACIHACNYYASRRSRTKDTVKLTVCVSVPAVTAQRLQCDEN